MNVIKSKSCIFCGAVKISAICLIMAIFFCGCAEDKGENEDKSISEITITNIPVNIPVEGNETDSNSAFKVYIFASNSTSDEDPSVVKGFAKVSEATLQTGGTHTVLINLKKANLDESDDINKETDPWSGEANYFTVIIAPQSIDISADPEEKGFAIWAKGGLTFNKGKSSLNWEGSGLMDFRSKSSMVEGKTEAVYKKIILKDSEIEQK